MLRLQDSNLDLTAPKAVVLPLHQGGPRCRHFDALTQFPILPDDGAVALRYGIRR